jgi:NADPH-dependent ferric siderophore reductase
MTVSMPAAFVLKACAELPEPEHCLRHLAEHLREDGLELAEEHGALIVTLPDVHGRMWCEDGQLVVQATSKDAETAYFVRSWLDAAFRHLAAGEPVRVSFEENWKTRGLPPSFSILKVQAMRMISRSMKRITLSCPDVARFDRKDALHIQLLVNFAALSQARDDAKPAAIWRRYTVRSIDVSNGTIDVDVFLHGGNGPGAAWASALAVGDMVGVAGPSGGGIGIGKAGRYLIAGDETTLPAIARILEMLPVDARGDVFVEVSEAADTLPLALPAGVTLTWLKRCETPLPLEQVIDTCLRSIDAEPVCLWVGCEAEVARRIRSKLRAEPTFGNVDHLVTGYWRRTSH